MASLAYVVLLILCFFQVCESAGHYKPLEKVDVFVNKVGPYFNPHETYHYYQLPVCTPTTIEHKTLTLGEVLDGDRMAKSDYNVLFQKDSKNEELCKKDMSKRNLDQLREAIEDLYYFEFVVDTIPVRGFVGHLEESKFIVPHKHKVYVFAHFDFSFAFNKDRIIFANVTTKRPIDITDLDATTIKFTYSVHWEETKSTFKDRGNFLKKNTFFPKTLEIHWLSVINSMILVFLLVGFVVIILSRILKNDFSKYNADEEDVDDMGGEENGWKIIHTDVFRFPVQKSLFCAILGVGSQFLALGTFIIVLALLGVFNVHHHGQINSTAIVVYAFTSCIAGYVAASMYKKMGGERWIWNINLTSCLFAVPLFMVWSCVNTVEWIYGSTQALPYTTIILLIMFWFVIGYPLTVLGGILGKNWTGSFDTPCRTKNIAREIPSVVWYKSAPIQCIIGGFLPFSAISVELYYIFSTLWGREQYTLWGILSIVYVMLLIVTAAITVALTYFQLNAEDYRWWWRSVFSAGSAAVFVFIYAMFYFFKRSNMSGGLQTIQFFGYTLLVCYIFFLSLGTVGFFACLTFIRYIYFNIKMD